MSYTDNNIFNVYDTNLISQELFQEVVLLPYQFTRTDNVPTIDNNSDKSSNSNGIGGLDDISVGTQLWIIIFLLLFNLIAGLYCCRLKNRLEMQKLRNHDQRFVHSLELQHRLRSISENAPPNDDSDNNQEQIDALKLEI